MKHFGILVNEDRGSAVQEEGSPFLTIGILWRTESPTNFLFRGMVGILAETDLLGI